jgi:uncharacterized membrane protein
VPGVEWLELAVRWIHVIAGIAWIGTSFYFIRLNAVLKPGADPREGVAGEAWEVHGGGFYRVSKYRVAPGRMPNELHWFKWEAYATWLSGASLLVLVYYLGADAFLLDRSVADIGPGTGIAIGVAAIVGGWLFYEVLCRTPLIERPGLFAIVGLVVATGSAWALSHGISGRAAYMHVGAAVGTIMAANVFLVIIPAHRKLVAAIEAGAEPEAWRGIAAARRSLHNNYLTLPVVFLMISNHYPMTYAHPLGWLMLGALALIGGWVRHYYNLRHAGRNRPWMLAVGAAGLGAVALLATAGGARTYGGRCVRHARRLSRSARRDLRPLHGLSLGAPRSRSLRRPARGDRLRHRGGDPSAGGPDPRGDGRDPHHAAREPHGDDRGGAGARRPVVGAVAIVPGFGYSEVRWTSRCSAMTAS